MNRVHSYPLLIQRWKSVARKAGRKLQQCALASGFPIYILRTAKMPDHRTVYLSAGIHGDEPAGTEALIVWAEQNVDQLRAEPFLILPCLNPWGLTNNIRLDAFGRDLNREWGPRRRATPVAEVKRLLGREQFALSLTLHEDYDASGLYIYEVQRDPPFWGEELLDLARPHLPVESRCTIDGYRARAGIVRRKLDVKRFPLMPEAIYLHLKHSRRTFTIETPSECALETRVAVQIAVISECIRRTRNEAVNSVVRS